MVVGTDMGHVWTISFVTCTVCVIRIKNATPSIPNYKSSKNLRELKHF